MTTQAKRTAALAVLLTILGAITAPLLGAAWSSKVSTSDYRLDIQRDSLWKIEQRAMTLEILCELKAGDRRCR